MLKRFFGFIVFLAVIAAALCISLYVYMHWPVEHPDVDITIDPGTSVIKISKVLEEKGVIKCRMCFRAYIGLAGYSSRLRAGDYQFVSGLTMSEVVTKLLKGDFKRYTLTIPEGWIIKQIADYLKTLPFIVNPDFASDFVNLTNNADYIRGLNIGWDVAGLEGYLFPSTYEVYKLKDAKTLVSLMVGEFKKRFTDPIGIKSGNLNLSPREVVIMASIIERETARPEERSLVASVFYNRLKKGMLIQSDPTVIYGLDNFDGNLRENDLANNHPYNTYVHPGLPPGPICNPGEASIMAALEPAATNYLYFVSRNDGTHKFSETYPEHQAAVLEYQIRKQR